jgi:hypothetical protein
MLLKGISGDKNVTVASKVVKGGRDTDLGTDSVKTVL